MQRPKPVHERIARKARGAAVGWVARQRHAAALAIIAASLAGCAESHPPSPEPTTAPSDIRLSDAQPLDDLQLENVHVTFTDRLDPPDSSRRVYFGEADSLDPDDDQTPLGAVPLIGLRDADGWRALPLIGPGLKDAGWKYVGAGPGRHEVWGVLDTAAGDSRGEFVIAHSTDGASSFALNVISKPCKIATVFDFAMSRDGHGRVTLSLDANCGRHKAGLYHYETTDDGKTWSTNPRYEPDAMIRADTVPDEEQPDEPQPPIRTLFKR